MCNLIEPKFGELYYALLIGEGSIQNGLRPVLVAQNDIGNKFSPTITIIPLTTKNKAAYMPTHIYVGDYNECGLGTTSTIMVEQIQTIPKTRLQSKIGVLPKKYYDEIASAINIQMPFSVGR